jgi:ABC-type branched-subunit amino acid transport system substrate-binding protein
MIRLLAAVLLMTAVSLSPALAQQAALKIAVHTSLTGSGAFAGKAFLDAIRFAVDEANDAGGGGPRFSLQAFDDGSTEAGAAKVAKDIIASDAALVLGPASSALALSVCPAYSAAGLAVIISTVHADELTDNPTVFRTVISTGDIGEALADYYGRVLHGRRVVVLSKDNGYGRPLAARFRQAAARNGLAVSYRSFATSAERDEAAGELAATAPDTAIVLGMAFDDAVPAMVILRRKGFRGMFLGTATMARASYNDLFARQPESRARPAFFTDNTYATSPMVLDSGGAEILEFARRFEARFGQEPGWESVQAYDAALLGMASLRDAVARHPDLPAEDGPARRAAAIAAIAAFDAPSHAVAAVNGPIWFTADHVRHQPVRIGRFHDGRFESAPLQIVPVVDPDPDEVTSGAVFQTAPNQFFRLQRVVQTGTFINLIPHLDVAKSTFGADFYLWLRFARDGGPGAADPIDISFPNMVSGHFNAAGAAEATEMDDGTEYRLWRIQGEFRNEYDLHRFPFDRQALNLGFFNARAASDRIVYVLDRRSMASPSAVPLAPTGPVVPGLGAAHAATPLATTDPRTGTTLVSPDAFSELTQWQPIGAHERRDTLVTNSALGDLRRVGLVTPRELSGFLVTFELQRRTTATLVKMLLPMLLMTIVMYSTLHFPHALTKEKVTVAVTAALSGAVLLASVNSQLGGVGYTIAVEYAFYVFLALGLLCIVYVMAFESLRLAGHEAAASRVEQATRMVFLAAVVVTVVLAASLYGFSLA